MTEKSQEARKRGRKAQKGDEAIYSLDPHSGLSDEMRRRLLLRRFWQSAGEFWGKDGPRRAWLLSAVIVPLRRPSLRPHDDAATLARVVDPSPIRSLARQWAILPATSRA